MLVNNLNFLSEVRFIAIDFHDNKVGYAIYESGKLTENELSDITEESLSRLAMHITFVDSVIEYRGETVANVLDRCLPSFRDWRYKPYVSIFSWTRSVVGELNLGSACQHFKISTDVEGQKTSGWNALDRSKMIGQLAIVLSSQYDVERYRRLNY